MPSSGIQVLWLWRKPCGVRPGLTGSQQASGVPSGMAWMPRPRGGVKGSAPGGWVATWRPGRRGGLPQAP
jgi:hypothetical protein